MKSNNKRLNLSSFVKNNKERAPKIIYFELGGSVPKINYSLDNIQKCHCPRCPVQKESVCTGEKKEGFKNFLDVADEVENDTNIDIDLPEPDSVPGVYCSAAVGTSSCDDLDDNQECLCPTCPVWEENNLKSGYYCLRGEAGLVDEEIKM